MTPEYNAWQQMRRRCTITTHPNYSSYGGRGITVCEKWLNSFHAFFLDMGERPSSQHSLERKDNDGNYDPENCKWGTKLEQSTNRRTVRFLTFRGKTLSIAGWTRETGLSHSGIRRRLGQNLPVEKVLTIPGYKTGRVL